MDNQKPHSFPKVPLHHLLQQQHQQLQMFWNHKCQEIKHATDFKNHHLPLARIKKIMKADEDVIMISADAPILFAKACELFILELTIRSWLHAEENRRRTLQKNDIAAAITRTDIFDFLEDIVSGDEIEEEGKGLEAGGTAPGVPYDHAPTGLAGSGVMMRKPAVAGADPSTYMHRSAQTWQQGFAEDGSCGGGGQGLDGQGYAAHPPPPPPPGH